MDDFYSILGKIKTENRRLTKTRVGILKALFEFKKPYEFKQIKRWLGRNRVKVDRSTIYRQLHYLVSKKFITKFQLASGKKYYELTGKHHHHLSCIRCKEIKNVALENCLANFEEKLAKLNGFKVLGHSFEFYGLCAECAKKPKTA